MINETIIKDNEWLIKAFINKYGNNYNHDDLYQAGMMGIIKAYNNYDKNSSIKFSTYAYNYVLGEIISYIKSERNIKISDEYISIYKKYLEIKELLNNKYNREVSFSEISKFMNISETSLLNIIEAISFTKSIDESIYEYGNDYRKDIDNKILIDNEIDNLNDFDKSIIYYRYYNDYSQDETAKVLNTSQAKISRKEKLILSKMKRNICA